MNCLPVIRRIPCAVAAQMALGVQKQGKADFGVGITGIAGPGGAEPGKPVGTVWVATSCDRGTLSRVFHFEGDRASVRHQVVRAAVDMLRVAVMEMS